MPIHLLFSLGLKLTIYRGLYIPDDDRWPLHFRGLNVRIEDSICVQSEHPLVLTTEAVKEVRNFLGRPKISYPCISSFSKKEDEERKNRKQKKGRNSTSSPLSKLLPLSV